MREYRRLFPKSGKQLLDGGLNNKFEKSIIQDNESPDCQNVVFENGAVATRQGYSKLNTTAVGTFAFDGLYVRKVSDGSQTMVAFGNGTMYALDGTTFTAVASATSIYTAGQRIAAVNSEDQLFHGNGGIVPHKWNGTDYTRHGVYPATTTSTVASQATGVLTGDYRYKITNVNSQLVESDVGPASTTFTAASATLRITIPTAAQSWGISTRRIYRTGSGGTTFKRVATISDNTTTTYDDNIADSSLGVTAPTDNGVPPNYSVICYHQNRLFMNDPANPNYVWYTELANPYVVKITNFRRIGDASGDIVKGISVYNNSIVVTGLRTITTIYMPSTDDTTWIDIVTSIPYGSKSPFCILSFLDKLFIPLIKEDKFIGFGTMKGLVLGQSTTLLTANAVGSDLVSEKIQTSIDDIQEGYLNNISGIVYKNKIYVTCTITSGSTTNNRVFCYDFSSSNLTKPQNFSWVPFSGINAAQFVEYAGNLYFASSEANGFVFKMFDGSYADNGSAINSYFWTKEFSGNPGEENFYKDFRAINALIDLAGAYFMGLTLKVDSDVGGGNVFQIDLNPGGSLWGSMVWGSDLWGGGSYQKDNTFYPGSLHGKRLQIKFSNRNMINQRFKVHWLKLTYNLKGLR